jgi:hypothetical protein
VFVCPSPQELTLKIDKFILAPSIKFSCEGCVCVTALSQNLCVTRAALCLPNGHNTTAVYVSEERAGSP